MLQRFLVDRSGNLAIIGALALMPLLGTAGLALDVTHAIKVRTRLQWAADAAVVGSITDKSAGVAQAMTMTGDGSVSVSESEARSIFAAQMANGTTIAQPGKAAQSDPNDLEETARTFKVSVVKTGRDINVSATFSTLVPTTFLKIFGKDSIKVDGIAKATFQSNSFMDFYMLLDNTPSMGVGATPADVDKLIAATKNQADSGSRDCAFACHIVSENGVADKKSNYFVARKVGATIRIDVVAQAVAALMKEAEKTETYPNQYRMAAYTFGQKAEDANLYEVSKLTDDLKDIQTKVDTISLMSIPFQGYNNDQITSFDKALTRMNSEITPPGDGSSPAKAEKVVYFVADGVGDSYKPTGCTKKVTGGRCQEPIDVSYCTTIKDRGIKIAVLYTTYLPLPTNGWYNTWIKPFQPEIGTKMQACASPGLYFEVSPSQGIESAMKALFVKIIRSPRLTS
ncbi:MAG: TadE/TadG family type IV pilus assembly protein [Pararhizobium sp.]